MIADRYRLFFVSLMLGMLLGVGACGGESAEVPDPLSRIGSQAGDLRGVDLTGTGVTDLAELAGKPTAVVFWLNSCPHCQEALPDIQEAWVDLTDDNNILTVGITNLDADGPPGFEDAAAFVSTTGLSLPTIEYTWEEAQGDWSVAGVPTVFILDDGLKVVDVLVGGDDLANRLTSSLGDVAAGGTG